MEVLIVDDVETEANLLGSLLEEFGYDVLTAFSAAEAVEILRTHTHLHLVLTDINMPEMTGLEAAHAIRNQLYNPLAIVGLSSIDTLEMQEACMRAGMNAFLPKPYNIDTLSDMLVKVGLKQHLNEHK